MLKLTKSNYSHRDLSKFTMALRNKGIQYYVKEDITDQLKRYLPFKDFLK